MSVDAFRKDRKTQRAVIRCLEVVGEATKIQPALRDRHPETPWQEIAGMRDKLIHEYFGVDLDIVWEAAGRSLVPFRKRSPLVACHPREKQLQPLSHSMR